ncbi:MAG: DNA primase [Patescibacteria group bacterium]|nr:DNA primase [Patescibacteria group bacterium]MDW8279705.1 DNA primase [bacterium]
MANSPVELIKEKLDIVEFIGSYIPLTKAGKNWKALCPFHKEKTPSFMISPERQSWHCFGCNIGGDIFTFLMKYENLDFGEALKILSEKAGIELKKISPQEYKYIGLLYELNEIAKQFFINQLENNQEALNYLFSRGLTKQTITEFEIGFAPEKFDELTIYLINLGYAPEDILRAGLAIKNERNKILDRFRSRIIFPIHNHLGKVVGFTGRILPKFENIETGKYINSPESPIFKKSKILYGFWKSKNFIREKNEVFLVEGQMDFLMSWQAQIKNVCASSGTALSEDHLITLRKLTDFLLISFDTDSAGWEAAEKAIDLANKLDFNVKIVVFDKFKDPADAVLSGLDFLKQAIQNAIPAPEFYFKKYLGEFINQKQNIDLSNRNDLKKLQNVLLKLLNIQSPAERNFWIKNLSQKIGVNENILIEESQKLQKNIKKNQFLMAENNLNQNKIIKKFNRLELLSQKFIQALIALNFLSEEFKEEKYLPFQYQKVLNLLKNNVKKSDDPYIDELINIILLGVDEPTKYNLEEIKQHLFLEYKKEKQKEIVSKIKQAESSGDEDTLNQALAELNDLLNLK